MEESDDEVELMAVIPGLPPMDEKPPDELPPNWTKCATDKKFKAANPDAPHVYYFNSKTRETRWLPPMPPIPSFPGQDNTIVSPSSSEPTETSAASSDKAKMTEFFHKRAPPTQSFADSLENGCDGELVNQKEPEEEQVPDEEEEELTELQKIQRQVFTGSKPVQLKMQGPDGLVERGKKLGVYKKNMVRAKLEEEIQKYWVKQCGGSENYFASPIFLAESQHIERERKECSNEKRKREFAEKCGNTEDSDDVHVKKKATKKDKPISTSVSLFL